MAQATPQGQINVVSTSILDGTTQNPFAVAPKCATKHSFMCGDWRKAQGLWDALEAEYLDCAVAQFRYSSILKRLYGVAQ